MASDLDVDQAIAYEDPITKELKATPYFEDYLFQVIQEFGGEGSDNPSVSFEESLYDSDLAYVAGQQRSVSQRVKDLENCIDFPANDTKPLRLRIKDLEEQVVTPLDTKLLLKRIEALESQVSDPVNLTSILQRIEALELQI